MKPMLQHFSSVKKGALTVLCSFLLMSSLQLSAQKSVYDVVPGSGPKKAEPASAPSVIKGTGTTKKPNRVYTGTRRRSLPPGQAKKIYGGSAKDYAPGQVKKEKRYKKHYKKHHKKNHGKHSKGHHHGKKD